MAKNKFTPTKELTSQRVCFDDPLAISNLKKIIVRHLELNYNSHSQKLIIVCIGTDRSTGDSLGPLVGSKLTKFNLNNTDIYGTLEDPVHATNLKEKMKKINKKYIHPFIIAVDAGLGKNSSVGSIDVQKGPLQPGSGVNKELPKIGDLHITGLVNISGYMEYFVLQSTRLNLVIKMSRIIAYALANGIKHF